MVEPSNSALVRLLKQELHAGEAESIVLAIETRPDVLLLDEAEARRVARLYDLPVTGIIGLLIQAKHEGLVLSLAEEMDRLREQRHFWIHDDLYRRVSSKKRRKSKSEEECPLCVDEVRIGTPHPRPLRRDGRKIRSHREQQDLIQPP
ncbi:MAG: DUF3368 domain-containing protein [Methanomicrobiaceae archaeon]|nr:DUF3368 domain-containing protein [Methanomicrobiaceae archaeon]